MKQKRNGIIWMLFLKRDLSASKPLKASIHSPHVDLPRRNSLSQNKVPILISQPPSSSLDIRTSSNSI